MKSFGMALDLKDDPQAIAKYREYHRIVWPEVIQGLRGLGITRMEIFLHGNRLFMYLETPDDFEPGRDFARYMESSRARSGTSSCAPSSRRSPQRRTTSGGPRWTRCST